MAFYKQNANAHTHFPQRIIYPILACTSFDEHAKRRLLYNFFRNIAAQWRLFRKKSKRIWSAANFGDMIRARWNIVGNVNDYIAIDRFNSVNTWRQYAAKSGSHYDWNSKWNFVHILRFSNSAFGAHNTCSAFHVSRCCLFRRSGFFFLWLVLTMEKKKKTLLTNMIYLAYVD